LTLPEKYEKVSISIINTQGKIVYSQDVFKGESELNIDISNLPNGIYFSNIMTENNFSSREKFTIVK